MAEGWVRARLGFRDSEVHPEGELWPWFGCRVAEGWVRARLGFGNLEGKTGPVALYGWPPGGPSASALDGIAREMAMEVACREAKERGIGATRGREARLAGLVLAGLAKKSVVTVVATVVASAVGMWAS